MAEATTPAARHASEMPRGLDRYGRYDEVARRGLRRRFPRMPVRCEVWLYDNINGAPVVRGQTSDVSNGGLRIDVPIGYGLGTGQELRFRMAIPRHHDFGAYLEEIQGRGSVVRAEIVVGQQQDALAVGMKFDLPMPLFGSA